MAVSEVLSLCRADAPFDLHAAEAAGSSLQGLRSAFAGERLLLAQKLLDAFKDQPTQMLFACIRGHATSDTSRNAAVLQGIFFNLYTMFYLISPKHCHAFVGYLEEEVTSHPLMLLALGSLVEFDRLPVSYSSRGPWVAH